MKTLIGALLYMGLTVGTYFYDFKGASRRSKIFSSIIFGSILLALTSWQGLLLVNYSKNQKILETLNQDLETQLNQQEMENKKLKNQLQSSVNNIGKSPDQPSLSYVNTLDLTNLKFEYFHRENDPKKLHNKLKQLESQGEIKKLSIFECHSKDCPYSTNALWYGSGVSLEQVRKIAKLLISSGINIKVIQPFFEPEKKDKNLIQIGTETRALSCRTWQKEEILNAKNFPQYRLGCP